MGKYDSLILMQLAIITTLGLIGVECAVLWLTLDWFGVLILGVLVITYFFELGYYVKIKYSKKCRKSFDKKKRK